MTRRATTSKFFMGLPVGDKGGDVIAWQRQGSVIKESGGLRGGGEGVTVGNFHPRLQASRLLKENIRTRLCV